MKKQETSTDKELLNKIFDLELLYLKKEQAILFQFYDIKLRRLQSEKEIELDNKPLKIFKKKHDLWLENLDRIDDEIENTFLEMKLEEQELFNN